MTVALSGKDLASQVEEKFPGSVEESGENHLVVKSDSLLPVVSFLKDSESLKFEYLNYITAVDYYSYFEVVYQLTSMEHNHTIVIKVRCYSRDRWRWMLLENGVAA